MLGPVLPGPDPAAQDLLRIIEPANAAHWLGTDGLGRDVMARLQKGAPRSLGLAILRLAVAAGLGTLLGFIVAYVDRIWDTLVMRLSDLPQAFPGILLALLLAGLMGGGIVPMLARRHDLDRLPLDVLGERRGLCACQLQAGHEGRCDCGSAAQRTL